MSPESRTAHDRLDFSVLRFTSRRILRNTAAGLPTYITEITRYYACHGYSVDLIYDSIARLDARSQLCRQPSGRFVLLTLPVKGATV